MAFKRRVLSPRKLLIASIGVATVSYVGCIGETETSGNLVAPCDQDPSLCSTGGATGTGANGAGGAGGAGTGGAVTTGGSNAGGAGGAGGGG